MMPVEFFKQTTVEVGVACAGMLVVVITEELLRELLFTKSNWPF